MVKDKYSHRASRAQIRIVDREGNPVKGAKVRFNLTNHEFLFGSGAFDSLPLTSDIQNTQIAFYSDKPKYLCNYIKCYKHL